MLEHKKKVQFTITMNCTFLISAYIPIQMYDEQFEEKQAVRWVLTEKYVYLKGVL